MAQINLGRIGFVNKGNWIAGVNYKLNDVVKYGDSVYAAKRPNVDVIPPTNGVDTEDWGYFIDGSGYAHTQGDEAITFKVADATKLNEAVSKRQLINHTVNLTENQTIAGVKTFSSNIVGNVTGNLSGNADTATSAASAAKLQTARTIALGGDLTGSVNFDGSYNVTLSAQVANDSHSHSTSTITGLGTAATRNVGTAAGNVMEDGQYGLKANSLTVIPVIGTNDDVWNTWENIISGWGTGARTGSPAGLNSNIGKVLNIGIENWGTQLLFDYYGNQVFFRGKESTKSTPNQWREFYHTGNTTKTPDGTLKASSPVINLYTDKHDLHNEEQFGATPVVTRKSKGVYEITGTLGLRSEGWYLDTPSDRNGNKYFNIEWTQNITPDTVDGVVDEYRDDIVVTIETFERVWNKDTGLFDNGNPIDINDLQSRFVQLRFNEIKVEQEITNG